MQLESPPFGERRKRLLARLDGVAVFFAAAVTTRNASVHHRYRQDSDFFYLTGFEEPESVLVVAPNHPEHRVVMFVRPRDAEREAWDGARGGIEGAVQRLGADAAFPITELAARLPGYFLGHERVYHRLGKDRATDGQVIDALGAARMRARLGLAAPSAVVDPVNVLHEMRLTKSDDEIARMQRAADITCEGHLSAMRLAAPGRFEYELEAALTEAFCRNGSERLAYEPIVGSGPNATVVHYRANRRRMEEGDLVLVDAGCEVDYYASDVTRTFPVSGRFSPVQQQLYEVVLEAQLEGLAHVRPGSTLDLVHATCEQKLVLGMIRLGLLEGTVERAIEQREHQRYFNHRTSHWLGMDVHDVGGYYANGKARTLAPGMVCTVEPGIYVRPDDDRAPSELRGLGVRIEDDVLITAEGHRVLTAEIPKTIDDVERACRA